VVGLQVVHRFQKLMWERHRRGTGGAALVRLGGGGSRTEDEQDRAVKAMRWRSAGLAAARLRWLREEDGRGAGR
jgi:hypothetical protein